MPFDEPQRARICMWVADDVPPCLFPHDQLGEEVPDHS